jgi:hypothetical protein
MTQQLLWGMGIPLGTLAFGGLVWATGRASRRPVSRGEWVLLMWALPFFAFTGALYAKVPRYFLPLTPVLVIYGARLVLSLRRKRIRHVVTAVCLSITLLHSIVFLSIHRLPHPWLATTDWFRAYVPRGSVVAVEQWDHPLPVGGAGDHDLRELPIFDEDVGAQGLGKWTAMDAILAEADYVVISSRRGYASLAGWPERYPLTAQYYQQLFAGDLGFEPVACFPRHPRLGPLAIVDDPARRLSFSLPAVCQTQAPVVLRLRLDESLVVYDHPRTIVFRRVEGSE